MYRKYSFFLQILIITLTAISFFFICCWLGSRKLDTTPVTASIDNSKQEIDSIQIYMDSMYPTYCVQGGLPDPKDKYRKKVSRWYKFRFIVEGYGCTDPRDNTIYEQNKKTDSILSARIGQDWEKRFEVSVDSLYNIDTTAIHIVKNNSRIKELTKKIDYTPSNTNYPIYTCHASLEPYIKIVNIKAESKMSKHTAYIDYLRAVVDLKKKKVILIEDTPFESPYPF